MKQVPWKSQIVEGRVFELRSKSKLYPAPCALIINDKVSGWNERMVASVDRFGCVGDGCYTRRHNPNIYVGSLRRYNFNSSHILRRRRDLERFDADDLALIRYGLALDFTGQIHGTHSDMHIPTVVPAKWTVFWLAAWGKDDDRWMHLWKSQDELRRLLRGAWYLESHGGSRHLGYRFGQAWATRHTGKHLNEIRMFLRRSLDGITEIPVEVARWTEGEKIYTEEVRRDCPALGSRWRTVQTSNGLTGICG